MILADQLTKTYRKGQNLVRALDGIHLKVERGEFLVVRGPSGSGKTSLLMILGAMQRPTSGTVMFDGRGLYEMNARQRAEFRSRTVGFVFQMFHLVPYLSVLQNVLLAGDGNARATGLLEQLGLANRISHRPPELSAGERQRTAIARALLNCPRILLADEPTGNLDPENARTVLSGLADFHKRGGTVVVATHESSAESLADRVIHIEDGKLVKAPS